MKSTHFTPATLEFLTELQENNNREWFNTHKERYEEKVRGPALDFIADFGPGLKSLSRHFLAIPKKSGGSMMRPYRDTRFSKDKTPYKTNIGIQFRHERGKDVHAPGYYLHIEPDSFFLGVGIWRPDGTALKGIREAIDENQKKWLTLKNGGFTQIFELSGSSLKTQPRGYPKDHLQIQWLRFKDFIVSKNFHDEELQSGKCFDTAYDVYYQMADFIFYLRKAIKQL